MENNSAPKRSIIGLNIIIQIILVGVIIVFINLAIHRWPNLGVKQWYPARFDLSFSDYYKLSDKTKNLLQNLKAPLEVIVFIQPSSEDPIVAHIFNDTQTLLKEYQAFAAQEKGVPLLKVKYVDPDRDPVSADKLLKEYNVQAPNVVVFVYDKRSKFVQVSDMVDIETSGGPFGGGGSRMKAFKGEQQFTSAIQNVLDAKQPKIYFLRGHGEGDPEDFDPRKGCSTIAQHIRRDNLLIEKLNVFEKQQIPNDCDVLIVCGPSKSFSELELAAIQQYLSKNGRALFLFDAVREETGLEKLVANYGVKLGNNIVLSVGIYLGGAAIIPEAHGVKYGPHPITKGFNEGELTTYFSRARSVEPFPSDDPSKAHITILAETPPEGEWGESDLAKLQQEQKADLDEKDRKGPVPLAVAIEPNTVGGVEREGMRMVIFGSSEFIRNSACLKGSNLDLFMNSLNWMLKRQQLIGIAPKTPQEFSLALSDSQKRTLFITEIVGIPLGIAALGFLVWLKRRK